MQEKLVLFDFDGTLADSAPDLAACANRVRAAHQLEPLPYDELWPFASHGARGLLNAAIGITPEHPDYDRYRSEFLKDYEANMTQNTQLFLGVQELLQHLVDQKLKWGIVTNKTEYLTRPLMTHLGLDEHCVVMVGGDTTPHIKPHPAPLFHAAAEAGIAPEQCIYIGDDRRDIQAGQAAGMSTVIAAYGYCKLDPSLADWQADAIVHNAHELIEVIQRWAQA